jgi:hypothetical protein
MGGNEHVGVACVQYGGLLTCLPGSYCPAGRQAYGACVHMPVTGNNNDRLLWNITSAYLNRGGLRK